MIKISDEPSHGISSPHHGPSSGFPKDTKYCSSVPAQNVTKKALNNVSADNQSFCRAVRWPTGGTLTKAGRLIKCAEPWAPRAHNVQTSNDRFLTLVRLYTFSNFILDVIQSWPTRAHVPNRLSRGPRFVTQERVQTTPNCQDTSPSCSSCPSLTIPCNSRIPRN